MNWIKTRRRSLFFKIFTSFLAVILLFGLFYAAIFRIFRGGLEQEIIQNNQSHISNTAERFSTHLERIGTLLFELHHEQDLMTFNRQLLRDGIQDADYLKAKEVISTLRNHVYNSLFFLEDIIIHFQQSGVTLNKSGSSSANYIFNAAYRSDTYPLDYWQQAEHGEFFHLLPSADFSRGAGSSSATLLPYTFHYPGSSYQLVAMIDIGRAAQSFFGQEPDLTLAILDQDDRLLYAYGEGMSKNAVPSFPPGVRSLKQDGMYYFKSTRGDGLTYISAAPYTHITGQLQRLTFYMLVIFMISLLVALLTSLYLSRRLHSPVKHMLSRVLDRTPVQQDSGDNQAESRNGRVWEFDLIQSRIRDLRQEKDEVVDVLSRQQAVLTNYSYMNKLKNINTDISEWNDFLAGEGSYHIVYYDIRFRSLLEHEPPLRPSRAVRQLLEHIHLLASESFTDAHTFQMEKHEVVSVLKGADAGLLHTFLQQIKHTLNEEKNYYLVNICISPAVMDTSEFDQAYHDVRSLSPQALLLEETQLIYEKRKLPDLAGLSVEQERQLLKALQSGELDVCIKLVDTLLNDWFEQGAGIVQYRQLCDQLSDKLLGAVEALAPQAPVLADLQEHGHQLNTCQTLPEYKERFRLMLEKACTYMAERQDSCNEPLVALFMEIIQNQYAEELSLDYLSEKMNLTSPYLSAYIKEKTGMNFSEHLQGIRMEKACELLLGTSLTVHEISQRVGYQNITSFNRSFKKVTGMTPGAYRREQVIQEHKSGSRA
ncbi:helix-turn-helix domain-containing protein [Paenibacillus lemnae]|uniref:Helix-turn-helix domain-containing protein n=1 Tax=Paenibacillus lemnae TaxID=1330551 RepID=A0A848M909_PAELE|nr:helix-turn-helix domain-containing protein [Paenibacillus lemnae]NMO96373.1 helix-turn-helix domain-containing protein [Paenibacillus lemnae]